MLRRTHIKQQRILPQPQNQKFLVRLKLAWQDTVKEYIETTRLSGVWLLRDRYTQGVTKWIWAGILFKLFALSVYLMLLQWLAFYSYPIIYSISDVISINDIAFPAVTMCSTAELLPLRREKFIQSLKIPPQYNISQVMEGLAYLNAFTNKEWLVPKNKNYKALDAVLLYNNLTILDASNAVNTNCFDLAQHCFWASEEFPCYQKHEYIFFRPSFTDMGPCCSLNVNPENKSFSPFASNVFGMDGGLTVIGRNIAPLNSISSLVLYITHPRDYITEQLSGIVLKTSSVNYIEIQPMSHLATAEVLNLSPNKRFCLVGADLGLLRYRRSICLKICQIVFIRNLCNCYPYHMPESIKEIFPSENISECKLKDVTCFLKAKNLLKTINCEHCMPNCYDTTYDVGSFSVEHRHNLRNIFSEHIGIPNKTDDGTYFMAKVYFNSQTVQTLSRVTTMSWISLLSNLGGIFNLCLGLTVISLIEGIYFVTYRLYVHYRAHSVLLVKPLYKH